MGDDPVLSHGDGRSNKNPAVSSDLALEYVVLNGIAHPPNRNDAVQLILPL